MMSVYSQLFPPKPEFTEKSLEDLEGRVHIVTGSTSGVGLELAKILYSRHATVYICGRSENSISKVSGEIKEAHSDSRGRLEVLAMDLSSLSSVQAGAKKFLAAEQRLDVLFHNAGVMTPPANSKSLDGFDLEVATNCLAPFLLTRLLQPVLVSTAQTGVGVRVVFVCSLMQLGTPEGGVAFNSEGAPVQLEAMNNYMQSKAGELFLASEFSKHLRSSGITSVACHPGLMKTNLQRNSPPPQRAIMGLLFKGPKYGAYTELYCGLSPHVKTGEFYVPWGRKGCIPQHLQDSMSTRGASPSVSQRFFAWCEQETKAFL